MRARFSGTPLLLAPPRWQAAGLRALAAHRDVLADCADAAPEQADAVLAVADTILVMISPADIASGEHDRLLARIGGAAARNGSAKILVVLTHDDAVLTARQAGELLYFVARLRRARLADSLTCDDDGLARPRHVQAVALESGGRRGCVVTAARHLYAQPFHGAAAMA